MTKPTKRVTAAASPRAVPPPSRRRTQAILAIVTAGVIFVAYRLGTGNGPAPPSTAAGEEPATHVSASPRLLAEIEAELTFLQVVPEGEVTMGILAGQLAEAACGTSFPHRPERAVKVARKRVRTAIQRSLSSLGPATHHVDAFLLGRRPVKNSQYEAFVARSRDPKNRLAPVAPPFLWWRYGRKDDYEQRLGEIGQRFPGDDLAPFRYWCEHGATLPYALVDENGRSIVDDPVCYLSYDEANAFAAHYGMRLPTEEEWTRAARGDGTGLWPWPGQAPTPPAGESSWPGAFGHQDMSGRIWQLVVSEGLCPINGEASFDAEWQRLRQHVLVGELVTSPPTWQADRIQSKGASHFSPHDPIQYLIDQRAYIRRDDRLEGVGLRLAKTARAGYDALCSWLRGPFDRSRFLPGQQVDLDAQIGIERYELAPRGFPADYHTVSFAPVDFLTTDEHATLEELLAKSDVVPLTLGVLVSTERIPGVASNDRMWALAYRGPGGSEPVEPPRAQFLLFGSNGALAAAIPAPALRPSTSGQFPNGLVVEPTDDGKARGLLRLCVRMSRADNARWADFRCELPLATSPW